MLPKDMEPKSSHDMIMLYPGVSGGLLALAVKTVTAVVEVVVADIFMLLSPSCLTTNVHKPPSKH